jgi:predicted nucleic acid-binding protein
MAAPGRTLLLAARTTRQQLSIVLDAKALIVLSLDRLDVLVSPALIAELTDVLGREKFAKHAAKVRGSVHSSPSRSIAAPRDRATMTEDQPAGTVKTADPDDAYLLALAHAQGVDAVVSGDRHLLDTASSELSVLTPRDLADRPGLASAA